MSTQIETTYNASNITTNIHHKPAQIRIVTISKMKLIHHKKQHLVVVDVPVKCPDQFEFSGSLNHYLFW